MLTRLYRHTCPPAMELGEYRLDMLARDRAESVHDHLAACPHCTREIAQLEAYLDDLAPDLEVGFLERIRERVRVVIARLIGQGGGNDPLGVPALAPVYAGLRGQEENVHLYEAEEMSVAIEIQDDADQPGRKAILGLALGPESPGGLAFLWKMQRRITVVPVDDLGNFVIPDLDAGSYELILSGPMVEIHIQELQVEGS
ncbi:MAG: hypothetical protein PVJ34_18065 [Anaerolineae bacterium]